MTQKRLSISDLRKKRKSNVEIDLNKESANNISEKRSIFVDSSETASIGTPYSNLKENDQKLKGIKEQEETISPSERAKASNTEDIDHKPGKNPTVELPQKEVIKEINNSGKTLHNTKSPENLTNHNETSYEYNDVAQKKNIFEDEVNIMDYLEIAYRYKLLILLSTITAILVAYLFSMYQVPKYTSSTQILIKDNLIEMNLINQKQYFKEEMDLKTWIQIINSSELSSRVSKLMNNFVTPGQAKASMTCTSERDVENILTINVNHINPNIAASIANNYFIALNEYDLAIRTDSYAKSIMYLEDQLDKKNKDIDSLDVEIKKLYAGKNFNDNNVEVNLKRLNSFKDMRTTYKVELESQQANIAELEKKIKEEDNSYISETTYSEPLKMRLLNLEVDLARALTKYGENHPKVLGIKTNITNLEHLIQEGAEKNVQFKSIGQNPLKQQLLSDLIKAQTTEISLTQKIKALDKVIASMELNDKDTSKLNKLQSLKKSFDVIRLNLQAQLNQTRLSENIEASRIVQLQEAEIPTKPSNNKLKMNLLIGLILGLGLGYGIALLLNMLDNKIRTVKELINNFPNIPVIGTIPQLNFSPLDLNVFTSKDQAEIEDKKDVLLKVFEEISLNFKYLILNREKNIIGVISSIKGEGKSTITNFLAIATAKHNKRVLLVDADFYNPRVSRYHKMSHLVGFSEVLSEQVNLEEAIVETRIQNLNVLPSGKKPPSVNQLYHSPKFVQYLEKLKEDYDIVIIDTPASMYFPETSILLSHLDCVLTATKMNLTTTKNIRRMAKKLDVIGIRNAGFIANSVTNDIFDTAYNDYYYGYEYYYYYKDNEKVKKKHKKSGKKKESHFVSKDWFMKLVNYLKNFTFQNDIDDDDEDEFVGLSSHRDKEIDDEFESTYSKNHKPTKFEKYLNKIKKVFGLSDDIDYD